MPTIIKASDRHHERSATAFHFDNLRAPAEAYLAKIREQAAAILAEARAQADEIRHSAEVAGRQAAEQTVDEELNRKVAEQLQTVLPALGKAARTIEQSKTGWLAHAQTQAVHLACAIAARVIRRELQTKPHIALGLVREALELATGRGDLRVLLHPDDFATLGDQVEQLVNELLPLGRAQVVSEAHISRGGCVVETRFGTIDQRFESQLARIEEELT